MGLIKFVPLVPFPLNKILKISRKLGLLGLSNKVAKLFPSLSLTLLQCESEFDDMEYVSIALFSAIFWFFLLISFFIILSLFVTMPANFFIIAFLASFGISFMSFIYVIAYPRLVISRKIRNLEKNLLFALRHLLIQVRSGVTLFDSMVSVSKADYGLVSEEFAAVVRKISTGVRDVEALEELGLKNPSLFFRRSLWQIANAIRSGADISATLESILNNLANEQRVMLRRYGAQLNPFAFMYMMFGIIIPTLGISVLITLSSFSGFVVSPMFFWAILVFLVVFKFNFLGIVKSRRPSIEVYV